MVKKKHVPIDKLLNKYSNLSSAVGILIEGLKKRHAYSVLFEWDEARRKDSEKGKK